MRVLIGVCLDAKLVFSLSLTVTLPRYFVHALGVIEFRVPMTFALIETAKFVCTPSLIPLVCDYVVDVT